MKQQILVRISLRLVSLTTILLLCCVELSIGQKVIPKVSQSDYNTNTELFHKLESANSSDVLHYFEEYELVEQALAGILGQPNKQINLTVGFKERIYHLFLDRTFLTISTYKLHSTAIQQEKKLQSYYYQGSIVGEKGWVTMAIVDSEIRILIAHDDGNIEIVKSGQGYVGFENHDRKIPLKYNCTSDDTAVASATKKIDQSNRYGSDCLEIYVECDFQAYLDNGSSVAQTEAWALSMINDVSAIYNAANLPLVVESVFVHNTSDPYAGLSNKMAVRDAFVNAVAGSQVARVGYLFSTRDLDGGISYGIGGLCGVYPAFPGPFAVATSLSSTLVPFPSYSFNTQVIAHELGHVLGARHTHACVWNGDDTQIDDCGNVWAEQEGFTPEGSECFDDQSPILPASGTVMSLCDLVGGVGINLANGFSPQVENLIFDNYDNALCSTGGECASIPPSNDDCSGATVLITKRFCVPETYDNIMATASLPSSASCGAVGGNGDVWFKYVSTGGVQRVTIDFNGNLQDVVAIAYTGGCGTLTEIACQQSSGLTLTLIVTGVLPAQEILIRIVETNNIEGQFSICVQETTSQCHPFESVLVDIYNAAGGNNWINNAGWASMVSPANCDVCEWYGITCDKDENIVELDLSFNNLVGTIPNSMEMITTLKKVNFFSNTLSGTMPDIWGDMSELKYLDLSANNFTGLIPRSLLNVPSIETLYLENNNLQDTLPKELGLLPNINVLWLKNNSLTGCFPATFAAICDISSKTFTGNIGLPGGGDFNAYCNFGIGRDADFDGFCSGSGLLDDCDDDDNTIYPSAPDICDGKDNDCDGDTDEGSVITVVWTGSNGLWSTAASWSTGQVPRICEDVQIGNNSQVTVNSGFQAYARSINVAGQAQLFNLGDLEVAGSDDLGIQIGVSANMENNGSLSVDNISAVGLNVDGGFENNGSIFVRVLGMDPNIQVGLDGQCDNNGGQIIMVNE